MKRLILTLGFLIAFTASALAAAGSVYSYSAASAFGLTNQIIYCPTATSTTSGTDLKCTPAQIAAYNYSLMSGDCTATGTGAVTCLKTNGVAFGTLATLSALPLSDLATQAANTVVGNGTGGSAAPTALAMPSCSSGTNALIWTSGTGFGCNTISGGGGVSSLSTSCPPLGPLTGAVTLPLGISEIAETGAFTPTVAQCGAWFDSTGGASATLPTIGTGSGNVENPYFLTIKNADVSASMTIGGGGANINYNGASSSSITLNAGQSIGLVVNAANTIWQATGTATGSVPVWHPGYISGLYYSTNTSPSIATGTVQVASSVYCALQQVNIPFTIKAMGSYFTTPVTSGNVSYAIFNASAGRPSTLIDYAGPIAAPTTAGPAEATLQNTTDTLAPGVYFYCETQDNDTGVMFSNYNVSIAAGQQWLGTSAPTTQINEAVPGISCTAASTCGTGYSAWTESPAAFTWASFTNPTWSTDAETTRIPYIKVEAN